MNQQFLVACSGALVIELTASDSARAPNIIEFFTIEFMLVALLH